MSSHEIGLIPDERRNRINELVRSQGAVRVSSLSRLLGVSELTVRRDLEKLEQDGILERTHGGAVYSRRMRFEPFHTDKDAIQQHEKRQIGAAAAALVEDGDTLLINSGSTTLQVIRHLVGKKNLRVITSNMGIPFETRGLDLELYLVGGTYREKSNSLVGPWAIRSLRQVSGNKCFIGVDGISRKYGLTTPNLQEAEVARTMIERTRGQKIVVADHSKLWKVADCLTAPLDAIHILVTDSGFDEGYREELEEVGVKIIVASG